MRSAPDWLARSAAIERRPIEEMIAPREARPLDPDNLRQALSISKSCLALDPRRVAPGIRKYRSIDEAWAARLEWELHPRE
jgi:hypothetical protein